MVVYREGLIFHFWSTVPFRFESFEYRRSFPVCTKNVSLAESGAEESTSDSEKGVINTQKRQNMTHSIPHTLFP